MPQRPDAYRLLQQAKRLPLNDLEHLVASLVTEVEGRKVSAQLSETTSPIADGWRHEYRKCGKPTCRCASTDYRHGPYLYRSVWIDGRAKKEYWRSSTRRSTLG
jgi:hypothetical protein